MNKNDAVRHGRRAYAVSTALIALGLGIPQVGFAQSASDVPTRAARTSGGKIEEITVTAEKRTSTAQKTAAALRVIGASTFQSQHIVQLRDLNSVLPNVQIVPVANSLQVAIRGLGSNFIDPRADPAAVVSVNGLYFSRALPGGFSFLDVARVESLSGPQGTLYGRNSAAGAINIVTNQPTTDRMYGTIQGTYGNYDENDVSAVLNVPISDTFAIRGAYERDRRNGYVDNYFNDNQSDLGRISAKWTPTADLKIYAEADLLELGGHGNSAEGYPCPGTKPFNTFLPASCSAFRIALKSPHLGHTSSFIDSDLLQVDYNIGFATLTSITGYVGNHLRYQDLPNGPYFLVHNENTNDDFTQEIRLTGNDNANHRGGLAWQVGTFLFDSTGTYLAEVSIAPTNPTIFTSVPQHSEAGFAQVTYGVLDNLRLTGGVRFTHDYKGIIGPAILANPPTNLSVSGNRANYKFGVEYDLAPNKLIYANTSTGYVAGGPNAGVLGAPITATVSPPTFKPETITAYEIGSKNRFLDNRLQLNGDFYYYKFSNYQITSPAILDTGLEALTIENAGKVRTYGVETQAVFAVTPDDRLSISGTYAEGHFGALDFPLAILTFHGYVPGAANVPSGEALVNLPKWVGLLGYEHTFNFSNGSSLVFNISSKLSTQFPLVPGSSDPVDHQKDFSMTDAGLAYHFASDRYVVRGYIKNIENSAVNTYGQTPALHNYGVLPPRTYGITASASF